MRVKVKTLEYKKSLKRFGQFFLLLNVMLLAACAAILPDHYTFNQVQLQQALEKRFPYERKVIEIFTIQLSQPVLTLLPESNRVRVSANIRIRAPIGRAYNGLLTLQSGVRYDPAQRALVLTQPQIEKIEVPDLPNASRILVEVGRSVVEPLMDNYVIKTFSPEELSYAGVTLNPAGIQVVQEGVRINLAK